MERLLRRVFAHGFALLALVSGARAGTPPRWTPIDGLLFDAAGQPVSQDGVEFQFSLQVIATGAEVAGETQYLDVVAGYYSTYLDLDVDDVAEPLEVVVSVEGEKLWPSIPIGSVPYSLRAAYAASAGDAALFDGLSLDELLDLARADADAVLLDGMTLDDLVALARTDVDAALLDGLTLDDLVTLARTDVDAATVGGLSAEAIIAAAQPGEAPSPAALTAGAGLVGGSYDGSMAATLSVGASSGILVSDDGVGLGVLTSDWNQTGAFDVVLGHAASEFKLLESTGATYFATLDAGDLAEDATFTLAGGSGTLWTSANDGATSGLDADTIDGVEASAFAPSSHTHATLSAGAGLSGGAYDGNASATLSVVYGTGSSAAVRGDQTLTLTAGNGLTGGVAGDALGDGASATLALGSLSSDWNQAGAYDLVLDNVSSEVRIRGAGGTFYGTLDVGNLSADANFTFTGGTGTVWTSAIDGNLSGLDADMLDGQHASAFAASAHTHATLSAGTGLSGGPYDGGSSATLSVAYGTGSSAAVRGDQNLTITAGAGLGGGTAGNALGDGASFSLFVMTGNGLDVVSDLVSLSDLTADWNQTAGYDIVLANAASELRIRELAGSYYGTFDIGNLSGDATYTFTGGTGTVWTSAIDGNASGLDADMLDGQHASAFAASAHTHATLSAGTGLSGGPYDGGSSATLSVAYGTGSSAAVRGDQTLAITAGNGLAGGVAGDSLGDGAAATLDVATGSGITIAADEVSLGDLESDWNQAGAYDLVLDNASSEVRIRGTGSAFYGTLDMGNLTADANYTFTGGSGTVWTSGNDGSGTSLDADTIDGYDSGGFWRTTGNSGTTAGTNYIGTSNNVAFEVKVNGVRGLRIEPTTSGPANMIGGYSGNSVTAGVYGATIAGGGGAVGANQVTDSGGTICGGAANVAGDSSGTTEDRPFAFVGAGAYNDATGYASSVVGGYSNTAAGYMSTVAGGTDNTASNQYSAVAGGKNNSATGQWSMVAGGEYNVATANYAGVFAGYDLNASGGAALAAGGTGNTASGTSAAVLAGNSNTASGNRSAVLAGDTNTAGGDYAIVLGGYLNRADGDYSLAAGRNARASMNGCFVWGDSSTNAMPDCNVTNRFIARASGGVYFYTNSTASAGVYVNGGGGSWASVSDRNAKWDIQTVDPRAVLDRLVAMPIARWRYRTEEGGIVHMGPMAQDFRAAFGLGDSDRSITSVDADGVAMAAIQGLYQLHEDQGRELHLLRDAHDALLRSDVERDGDLAALRETVAAQQQRIAAQEARLLGLEAALQALSHRCEATHAAVEDGVIGHYAERSADSQ